MEVFSSQLPFEPEGMSEDAYLLAVSEVFGVCRMAVPSNGGCFFDSIFALLPTVSKAVVSAVALREQLVSFFRECQSLQHGLLGERIMDDVVAAMRSPIVSSWASTRGNGRRPKTVDSYFDSVSKRSVWVEGVSFFVFVLFMTFTLLQVSTGSEPSRTCFR